MLREKRRRMATENDELENNTFQELLPGHHMSKR